MPIVGLRVGARKPAPMEVPQWERLSQAPQTWSGPRSKALTAARYRSREPKEVTRSQGQTRIDPHQRRCPATVDLGLLHPRPYGGTVAPPVKFSL